MTAEGLASLPVARATVRERGPGLLPAAFAVLTALAAFSNAAQSGYGGEAFSGFARLFLIALTMVLGAGLISDEIDSGHAQLVLLRPLTRAGWYGGRLLGAGYALLLALGVAWIAAGVGTFAHKGRPDLAWLLALPSAFLEAFGWLSVLAALSVVVRRSVNVGILLLAAMLYFFSTFAVPIVLGKPSLIETLRGAGTYLGPQELTPILRALRTHAKPSVAPILYDLLWIFAPWLCGVLLLNRRELARRRG